MFLFSCKVTVVFIRPAPFMLALSLFLDTLFFLLDLNCCYSLILPCLWIHLQA